jgi:hypothetical protein
MSGDPANKNDDELLGQIDELKARMDRLMSGGSSTSNSALLADDLKSKAKAGSQELVDRPADPAPNRTRVRDLIGPEDVEVVEPYPAPKDAVSFADDRTDQGVPDAAAAPQPQPAPAPQTRPTRSAPIGGSVVKVEEGSQEPRPQVATFDDLGSAIQEELANDTSVPPADIKKGPDLANRFGPIGHDEPEAEVAQPDAEVVAEVTDDDDGSGEEDEFDADDQVVAESRRGPAGMVAAIWIGTAVASGAIATLHFAGII